MPKKLTAMVGRCGSSLSRIVLPIWTGKLNPNTLPVAMLVPPKKVELVTLSVALPKSPPLTMAVPELKKKVELMTLSVALPPKPPSLKMPPIVESEFVSEGGVRNA